MLVDLGLDPYTIDKAIQFGFGMPMGPFRCGAWPSGRCMRRTLCAAVALDVVGYLTARSSGCSVIACCQVVNEDKGSATSWCVPCA